MLDLAGRVGRAAGAIAAGAVMLAGCGGDDDGPSARTPGDVQDPSAEAAQTERLDRVVRIGANRTLYLRCSGTGSPTVLMEAGDGDTSESYAFAEEPIAKVTRTCVYDRANLGRSGPAPGPRGLTDLVDDLERLLRAARVPAPYVLVGTSGGGYITAGYAVANPRQVAGMAFIETPGPFRDPPPEIVGETDPDNPENVERRDYLQVERDAWAARKRIGSIPVSVVTDKPSAAAIRESPFPSERRALRSNVEVQKGWLVLSPRAKQIVVRTGHAVEEEDPELVVSVILGVVKAAR
ncbi:MAG TPA: alpha/beta hydrolase [Solirubrobacteraceae bacterium]|nr:alpha/beta hydrolase [Solirubrobacteraceae bacterium]